MSVANFFDKILLGASQWLTNYDREKFENLLNSHVVLIHFDNNGSETSEGRASLDLITRLLARLYPKLIFSGPNPFKEELESLAKSINPDLEVYEQTPTICVVVGQSKNPFNIPTFYLGSQDWVCKFSKEKLQISGNSGNPFGAGAAACFAAANIFRLVFKQNLPHSDLDEDFSLSLLDFSLNQHLQELDLSSNTELEEVHLVGLGAIGHGTIWALRHIQNIKGNIVGIDPETISLSNLQRYVLAIQENINQPKTDLIKNYLTGCELNFYPVPSKWEGFISKKQNWSIKTIAVCVDNSEDRIMVQASLPRKLFNAWTQPENIGVSSHLNFGDGPCLSCLYLPESVKKSKSQEVADNLNLSQSEIFIRRYLANQYPVDEGLITAVAQANNLETDKPLRKYIGQSLQIFYSEVVCGGVLMNLATSEKKDADANIQVPSAFDSAFAGILLAAELVKDNFGYKSNQLSKSIRFNLIRSLGEYFIFPELKKDNCICNDIDYIDAFHVKWSLQNI